MAPATAPRADARHVGGGVPRREAHHEQQAADRARQVQAADALPPETDVRPVPAAEVLAIVEEVGPNYRIVQRTESKKERRERLRAQPEERK